MMRNLVIAECMIPGIILFLWTLSGRFQTGSGQFPDLASSIQHRHACNSPEACRTNHYSIECPVGRKIVMQGVSYGAKPYTAYCPETQSCVSQSRCCQYHTSDCLISYEEDKLFDVYRKCSRAQQCGWLFASSIELKDKCQIRKRSNYVRADFQCITDDLFIDVCRQQTVTAPAVQLYHSAIPPAFHKVSQCSCVITPDTCNNTAFIQFRSVDVRLHDSDNITSCDRNSRVELVGQNRVKTYDCKAGEFLHGFDDFHTTEEKNIILYLNKKDRVYPTNFWLEVKASLPGVGVRVTCGPRSVQTAKRCPAPPPIKSDNIDHVDNVPDRPGQKPTVIHLNPEDVDTGTNKPGDLPSEKQNPAMAAIIGGISAGVVVLILLLVVVCLILRKKKRNKNKDTVACGKRTSLPYADELHQVNFYESIGDADNNKPGGDTASGGWHIYHQPWGNTQGVRVDNRAKQELAYATSEEIKVLIEKMEKDRQFLNEGDGDTYPEFHQPDPDPVYYRHISNYSFRPTANDHRDGGSHGNNDDDDSETESKSDMSENCGTEKLESEDSKVEADRGIDSDIESHRVESEIVSAGYDGYESPRVSSFQPSDASESVRDSVRSSEYFTGLPVISNQSHGVIPEDSQLDCDVPYEPAPPVSEARKSQSLDKKITEGEVTLGGYRAPVGSLDKLNIDELDDIEDIDGEEIEGHHYSPVYDKVTDSVTKL